ncbi:VOC family protein [Micromonospora soli]|uniref:VOC family protein n=1 Tax=Micromonospora sp. NBRC 110009 TaxID=3061627 RepID=UPI0026717E75|nr:VOC family protein [Micromonospora sp. NBRC 110009]WKU01170.1 VOC family protein [Micromonospora sp. NBRC 110009]
MSLHPRVVTDDFPATLRFWAGLLGEPEKVIAEVEYASFDQGGQTVLALLGRRAAEAVLPVGRGDGGVLVVVPVPDVDAVVAALPDGTVVAPPADRPGWGIRAAYLRDPEGNLVEVQTWLPRRQHPENATAPGRRSVRERSEVVRSQPLRRADPQ